MLHTTDEQHTFCLPLRISAADATMDVHVRRDEKWLRRPSGIGSRSESGPAHPEHGEHGNSGKL